MLSASIRAAGEEDVAALFSLNLQAADATWSEQNLSRYCQGTRYRCLLAERGQETLGFILYSQVCDEASVDNIVVARAAQRSGLGTALLNEALGAMAVAGAGRCLLEVRRSNTAARKLYARSGFTLDGVRARYYATARGREDALLMSRRL